MIVVAPASSWFIRISPRFLPITFRTNSSAKPQSSNPRLPPRHTDLYNPLSTPPPPSHTPPPTHPPPHPHPLHPLPFPPQYPPNRPPQIIPHQPRLQKLPILQHPLQYPIDPPH